MASKETQLASLVSNLVRKVSFIRGVKMARFKFGLTVTKLLRTSRHILKQSSAWRQQMNFLSPQAKTIESALLNRKAETKS